MFEKLPKFVIKLINNDRIIQTKHFLDRQFERDLRNMDIKKALLTGKIIGHYPKSEVENETYIIYNKIKGKTFHIVFKIDNCKIILVTIYIPDEAYFEKDLKTRKHKK